MTGWMNEEELHARHDEFKIAPPAPEVAKGFAPVENLVIVPLAVEQTIAPPPPVAPAVTGSPYTETTISTAGAGTAGRSPEVVQTELQQMQSTVSMLANDPHQYTPVEIANKVAPEMRQQAYATAVEAVSKAGRDPKETEAQRDTRVQQQNAEVQQALAGILGVGAVAGVAAEGLAQGIGPELPGHEHAQAAVLGMALSPEFALGHTPGLAAMNLDALHDMASPGAATTQAAEAQVAHDKAMAAEKVLSETPAEKPVEPAKAAPAATQPTATEIQVSKTPPNDHSALTTGVSAGLADERALGNHDLAAARDAQTAQDWAQHNDNYRGPSFTHTQEVGKGVQEPETKQAGDVGSTEKSDVVASLTKMGTESSKPTLGDRLSQGLGWVGEKYRETRDQVIAISDLASVMGITNMVSLGGEHHMNHHPMDTPGMGQAQAIGRT